MTSSPNADEGVDPSLEPIKPFAIRRSSVILASIVVLVASSCLIILRLVGWTDQGRYVLIGAAVCGGSAILSMIPVWLLSYKSIQGAAQGFLAGILIRMAICGGAVLIVGRLDEQGKTASSMWIAGWYMMVLLCELALVGSYIKRGQLSTGAKVGKNTDSVKPGHIEDENHS